MIKSAAMACCRHGQVEVEECTIRKDTSAVVVQLDKRESLNTEKILSESLEHIAKTIFPPNGRLVKLQVERSLEPEVEQPATAAGRFAK